MKKIISFFLAIILCLPVFSVNASDDGLGRYTVVATSLNLRAEPVSGAVIGALSYGEVITVTEISNGWAKTTKNGKTGWCSLRYLVYMDGEVYGISDAGLELIKGFEGYVKYAYWDYEQWTIGYGTRCEENEYPNGITEPEAAELLKRAIVSYEMSVNAFLSYNGISVTQNQFDALVSLTYNIGSKWTNDSTLATYLKNGVTNYSAEAIKSAFGEYIRAGGEILQGLVERREKEAEYFLSDEHFHSYKAQSGTEATCTTDGEMTYACACGESYTKKLEKTGHSASEPMVTREPTKTEYGIKLTRCIMCGIELGETQIPKIMPDAKDSAWYYEGLKYCVIEGYIQGDSKGNFAPNSTLTREQFVVMLSRLENADVTGYKSAGFKDVSQKAWYAPYVNWAAAKGYVKGMGDGSTFGVGRNITRQELCVMFKRFADAHGLDTSASFTLSNFSDSAQIASWAKKEVSFAVGAGLMSSTTKEKLTFSPKMSVTRAQAVKIFMSFDLYRFA